MLTCMYVASFEAGPSYVSGLVYSVVSFTGSREL